MIWNYYIDGPINWRMSFNPDPHKQAVELVLSTKRHEIDHPMIFFNDIPVEKVDEHKHLGVILDRKLSFSAHINAAICKARRGIGLLKHLSRYLPRHTLNELYKLHVRPFLDYGDVIYHIPFKVCEYSKNTIVPRLMEKLESDQYSAALAVTGTWRGTSCDKLYVTRLAELGWESFNICSSVKNTRSEYALGQYLVLVVKLTILDSHSGIQVMRSEDTL